MILGSAMMMMGAKAAANTEEITNVAANLEETAHVDKEVNNLHHKT